MNDGYGVRKVLSRFWHVAGNEPRPEPIVPRPVCRLATAAVLVAAACGSSSPSSPSSGPAEALVAQPFVVMTFNIQHGLNGAGKYGLQAAIDTIARVNPDLVGVQELTRNHPSYNCEDQPARIAEGLSAATGRSWTAQYQQEWTTTIRDCPMSGRGDGPETEGIGFFAPTPVPGVSFTQLWNGRVGLWTLFPRGQGGVPVVVTHLAHGLDGQPDRLRQLDALLPWALSKPPTGARVLIGDFNHSPGTPEYERISASYRDAWADALGAGKARGRMDGITHKSSRIDYIFYVPGNSLELNWVDNIDTRTLVGSETSDHDPLVASFNVR